MASLLERLALIIDFDGKAAIKGLDDVARKSEGADKATREMSASLTKFGAVGLAASGVAAVGLGKLAQGASDLNETLSKSRVIFGTAADTVGRFGDAAAESLGLSKQAAIDAASTFGTFGKAAGKSGEDLAKFSTDLVGLAGDLASFSNTTPEEAVEALGAALRGESEPIRRYGVLLDDATLKNRALEMGLISTTSGTLPPAIKMQAAYAEILAQTTDAQGDFARTSDGAANQQRILRAELKNLADGIGSGVLPMFTALVSGAAGAVGQLNDLGPAATTALGTLAAGGTGVLAAVSGISLVAGQVIKLRDRFTAVENGARALTTAGKFASGAALGVGVLAAAMVLLRSGTDKAVISLKDLQAVELDLAASKLRDVREALERATKRLGEHGDQALSTRGKIALLNQAQVNMKQVNEDFNDVLEKSPELAQRFIDAAKQAGYDTGEWETRLRDTVRATADHQNALEEYTKVVDAARTGVAGTAGEVKTLAERQQEEKDAAEKAAKAEDAHAKSVDLIRDAYKEANDRARDLLGTQDELYRQTLDLDEKIDNLGDVLGDVHDAQADAAQATKEHGAKSDEAAEAHRREEDAVRKAQLAVADIAIAAKDGAEKQAALRGETLTAEQAMQAQRLALEEAKEKWPEAAGAIDDYIRKAMDPLLAKSDEVRLRLMADAAAAKAAWDATDRRVRSADAQERAATSTPAVSVSVPPASNDLSAARASILPGGTYNVTVHALDPHAAAAAVMDAIKVAQRNGIPLPS